MDGFRFILENPHPNASNNKPRKRARLVTACDSCRVKKIKCQQPSPNGRCEACKSSKTPCLFGDRDRYQAERGVSCTWNTPAEEALGFSETSSRKRKMTAPSPSASDLWTPASASTSAAPSRSGTPVSGSVSNYRYFLNEQRAGPSSIPSFVNSLNIFPGATHSPHSPDPSLNATYHDELPLFDPTRPRFPHPRRMCHLGALFFDNVGAHFPFLDRYDVLHRIEQRTCSAILSNVIAGLAVRFTNPARPDPTAAAPFYDMAKSLAAHVVSVPSVEALHALICMTWVEYGAGHDDGFWRYSRMAIAMCLDLGLGNEATIQVAATSDVRHRLRLTWWMVVCVADIAASWATGRPCALDLELFDTELPSATDDASLLFRNIVELFVLRGKLTGVLEVHVENHGDSSLDWDLAELKADLKNISKELPPLFVFNEANLTNMHNRRLGHVFVQMHLLIHGVSALLNRPSLLPSYGLPVPTEGPRAEAARSSAKALVDVLMVVEDVGPHVLRDPFMDLPILVASRAFIAENESQETIAAGTRSSQSNELTRQWSETFLIKCKEFLAQISSAYGSNSSFEAILHRHGGTVADDPHFPHSSPSDLFTAPNSSHRWFLHPGLVDDNASDTSSSFRSSSHELSPRLGATPANSTPASEFAFGMGDSPLVRSLDDTGMGLDSRDLSFHGSDFLMPSSFHDGDGFNTLSSYLDAPSALHLSIDSPEGHRLLNIDTFSQKETISRESPLSLFSPLPWLTRA